MTVVPAAARDRLARVITEVAAPWVWCVGLPYAVGIGGKWSLLSGLAWATLIAVGAAVVPMALILRGIRAGRVQSGHHVTSRAERYVPLVGAIASVGAVIGVLAMFSAPRPMIGVAAVMLATVITALAITHWWKISMHTAVASGSVVVLTAFYGIGAAALWAVVAAIAWSRVRIDHHTTGQVIAGIALGTATGLLFDVVA